MAHSVMMDNPSTMLETFRNYNIYHYMRALSSFELRFKIINDELPRRRKDNINVNMSLRELFEEGLEQEGQCFECSCPAMYGLPMIPTPYNLSYQATVEHLNTHLICLADIFDTTYPVSATSFWLVATKGAISYMHCDCHGVGTGCGGPLWEEIVKSTWGTGHLVSFQVQMNGRPRWYCWNLGSAFYMRPDTHHAVLTLENSIVKGHHIYATTTLAKSVMGWIHTCMLEYRIANVLHPELHELLLCIMCHFYRVMTND
ncbi:hypothetical protein IW261DRAFT_1564120 [Armillaria novae-zelandiae]|uniref:JmjC domain-containing protein n=1 Tax=Armillaria novae-zelandiae TaxID=153914 RepID=A0AA39P8W8_9AGAR|nr:hypothetical protein IW261DRAFT_1564120 [Armillaria novae-zelandiae]